MAIYPDTDASTLYRVDQALFQGDPASILTGSFSDTGSGVAFTLSSGGSAFSDLWDSAHVVWRALRRSDGSPVPPLASAPQWGGSLLDLRFNTVPAGTENIRAQLLLIGAPSGATQLSDISGGSPVIIGGGLNFGNASGPQACVSTGSGGGTASGARGASVVGARVVPNGVVNKTSTELLFHSRTAVWTYNSDGTTANTGGALEGTLIDSLLDSTNTDLYFMLSILKIGSATGGSYEVAPRSRLPMIEVSR